MSFMVHCNFEKGSQNQHFQSTILVGREDHKKGYSVYALDNVDNSGNLKWEEKHAAIPRKPSKTLHELY